MTDMLALIASVKRHGCPNCWRTDGLRDKRKTDPANKEMCICSLECGHCSIEWQAPPIPFAELGPITPPPPVGGIFR